MSGAPSALDEARAFLAEHPDARFRDWRLEELQHEHGRRTWMLEVMLVGADPGRTETCFLDVTDAILSQYPMSPREMAAQMLGHLQGWIEGGFGARRSPLFDVRVPMGVPQ